MVRQSEIGKLIVLEGPDGVGKTTLSRSLEGKMAERNIRCKNLSFPGQEPGTLGCMVYDIHHKPDKFGIAEINPTSKQVLHIAAHLETIEKCILPFLEDGCWVILDRFWWSTWVYGRIENVVCRSLELMIGLEKMHWDGVKPDVVFLIERSALSSSEAPDCPCFHEQLVAEYSVLADKEQGHYPIRRIQNNQPLEKSVCQIMENLQELVDR